MEFDRLSLSVMPCSLQAVKLKWSCDTAAGEKKSKSKLDIAYQTDEAVLRKL